MCDCMRFPDTVEEFMEQYKVVDKEGIYMSKGAKLVPIFRMEQWFEHEKAQLSQEGTTKGATTDTISRQAAIGEVKKHYRAYDNDLLELITFDIERLPSAQPERPKGEWIDLDSDTEKYDDIMCSNCKQSFTVDAYRWCDIGFTVDDLKFCPNCGADMRGKKDG